MKNLRNLLLLPLIGISFCLTNCGKSYATPHKYTYADMDEDTMPISAWVAPYGEGLTNENYRLMKEAGFTSIYACYNAYSEGGDNTAVYKSLEYAQNNGILYFPRDYGLFSYTTEADFKRVFESRGYTNYSSFGGFLYGDEPLEDKFPNYAAAHELFKKCVPSKYCFYANLLPAYGKWGNSAHDYEMYQETYLRDFLKQVKTPYISVDQYSLIEDPYMGLYVRDTHFDTLYSLAKVTLEEGVPFWAFACSTEHIINASSTHYKNPGENDIFWQVNTSLAYGAKGMQYFCYQDPGTTNTRETYELGGSFLNKDGTLGECYPHGKKMNLYIHSIDHILMNANLKGMLVNDTKQTTKWFIGYNVVESIDDISSMEASGDVIVSAFEYQDKTVYFAVNFSPINNASVTLNYNKKISTKNYPIGEDTYEITKSKTASYDLEPGHCVLIEPF